MSEILKIRHLSKAFGKNVVLRDIDFTVNKDIPSDVNGSYTGVPADGGVPVQDSDDL